MLVTMVGLRFSFSDVKDKKRKKTINNTYHEKF